MCNFSCPQQTLSCLLDLVSQSIAHETSVSFLHDAHSAVGNVLLLVDSVLFQLFLQLIWFLSLSSFPLPPSLPRMWTTAVCFLCCAFDSLTQVSIKKPATDEWEQSWEVSQNDCFLNTACFTVPISSGERGEPWYGFEGPMEVWAVQLPMRKSGGKSVGKCCRL